MKKRIFQKDPQSLTNEDHDYCRKCGHYVDYRVWDKETITKHIKTGLCKFCKED